jgi:hypothetical protein
MLHLQGIVRQDACLANQFFKPFASITRFYTHHTLITEIQIHFP